MTHLCRCPSCLLSVATPCRPHGETSVSWRATVPVMSHWRYTSRILFFIFGGGALQYKCTPHGSLSLWGFSRVVFGRNEMGWSNSCSASVLLLSQQQCHCVQLFFFFFFWWLDSESTTFLWILIIHTCWNGVESNVFGHTSTGCKICCWHIQGDNYVLPLLWRGTPAKVSCPASQAVPQSADPPTICCAPYSVTVKLHEVSSVEELGLNGKYRSWHFLLFDCAALWS